MKAKFWIVFFLFVVIATQAYLYSQTVPTLPKISIGIGKAKTTQDVSNTLMILILMTIISVSPGILIMLTAFTRITIILSFTRRALATQQTPSNQVLIGLALFLTFYVMSPVFLQINTHVVQPYLHKKITLQVAYQNLTDIVRSYMLKYTNKKTLMNFYKAYNVHRKAIKPKTPKDVPLQVLIPAYIVSEMTVAFKIGFIIFIPFLIIDMVVATILMSMGMVMLSPITISIVFKILLFILIDGWNLIVKAIMASYGY
jgi:flagellar biosynthetic protein FliP